MVEVVTAKELRGLNSEELKEKLGSLELELQGVLQSLHSRNEGREDKRVARKNIARCKAVIHEKRLEMLVEEYKGKKYMPKELRPKLNKSLRMRLTKEQMNRKSRFQRVQRKKYPQVVFSVKE
jgi:large subunit ribosomal protein L35e